MRVAQEGKTVESRNMICRRRLLTLLCSCILTGPVLGAEADKSQLDLHAVKVDISSYRLLAMSMDDEGFVWAGSIHRMIHRYDPRTGKAQSIQLPYDTVASTCICVGKKVYILGQSYPKLMIYDRASQTFSEKAYPSARPDVWYGTEAVAEGFIYLFDRGSTGVIRWDTHSDTGEVIPWPYNVAVPSGGRIESRDRALWCNVWIFQPVNTYPLVSLGWILLRTHSPAGIPFRVMIRTWHVSPMLRRRSSCRTRCVASWCRLTSSRRGGASFYRCRASESCSASWAGRSCTKGGATFPSARITARTQAAMGSRTIFVMPSWSSIREQNDLRSRLSGWAKTLIIKSRTCLVRAASSSRQGRTSGSRTAPSIETVLAKSSSGKLRACTNNGWISLGSRSVILAAS